MTTPTTHPYAPPLPAWDRIARQLSRRVLLTGLILVTLLCVLVVVRRIGGTIEAALHPVTLLLVAVLLILVARGFRIAWEKCFPEVEGITNLVVQSAIPLVCIVSIAASLSLPGTPTWGLLVLWVVIVIGEALWWFSQRHVIAETRNRGFASREIRQVSNDMPASGSDRRNTAATALPAQLDPDVTQHITRSRNKHGIEVISGFLRAEFLPGEQTRNLHVAFCPPLDYPPRVTTKAIDGADVSLKVGQAEIFGLRLELRRTTNLSQRRLVLTSFDVQPYSTTPSTSVPGAS